jgi:hypothetical protein
MKTRFAVISLVACLTSGGALAQSDDARWVNQCVRDSAGYNVTQQVKIMYCTCMVGKMDDNETRSVTQWERANPAAARDCARRAGWD